MFGIDSPELLVIAIVALVVIGPKELPSLLRTWGRWMSRMRGMAAEFRGHVDEMVRQSELDEVKKQLEANTPDLDFKALDPTREIKGAIQEGMAEGEKALAESKSSFDLLGVESAPVDQSPVTPVDQSPVTPVDQSPVTPVDQSPVNPVDNVLAEPESAPQIAAEPPVQPVLAPPAAEAAREPAPSAAEKPAKAAAE